MRDAINNNPVVQISVMGILLVVVGLLFVTTVFKGGDTAAPIDPNAPANTAATGLPATDPAGGVPVDPAGAPTGPAGAVDPATGLPTTAPGAGVVPTGSVPAPLEAGPGLPAPIVNAYKDGKAIALLIAQDTGIEDRLVERSVEQLKADPRVAVFVARAEDVARYSRITEGVGVNRVPALVVIRPRKLSGPTPQAMVSYGFRDSKSVVQAVRDALYVGPDNRPYYPD